MNYIFDIGNVLVTYNPRTYLEEFFTDDMAIEEVLSNVFFSDEWLIMDEGKLPRKDGTKIFCERLPQYKKEIESIMDGINETFLPIESTINHLPKLKSTGHGLYYLSNISFEARDHLIAKYDFFDLFDGGIFSCDEHIIKPNPEIYRLLLRRYKLKPSDCIFFDDMEKNIVAAENEGITGVLVTDSECVTRAIVV
jgi:putative hydrolase of the HAD superfamily